MIEKTGLAEKDSAKKIPRSLNDLLRVEKDLKKMGKKIVSHYPKMNKYSNPPLFLRIDFGGQIIFDEKLILLVLVAVVSKIINSSTPFSLKIFTMFSGSPMYLGRLNL